MINKKGFIQMILYDIPEFVKAAKIIAAHRDLTWEKKWIAMSIKAREGMASPFALTMSEEEVREKNHGDDGYLSFIIAGGTKEVFDRFGRTDYVYLKTRCPFCGDLAWGSISHLDLNNGWQTINRCRCCSELFIAVYHPPAGRFRRFIVWFVIVAVVVVLLIAR